MAKKTSTPRQETAARIARTEAYANKVRALFATTVNQILALNKSVPQLPTGEMFSFDAQSQKMQKQVEQLLRQLHSVATMAIQQGITLEWGQANAAADQLVRSVFGKKVMESPEFSAWGKRNAVAMQAFMNRSEKGLNLSDRVWQSVRQLRDEMEVAITISVGEGKSAQKMSQDVRQYLNDPDLMFRRFRYKDPETGEWKKKWKKRIRKPDGTFGFVDCDRDSYRTGQGVYKSSAKNAMRVARTETNIAYRRADNKRWSQMDFVLGQRVQLSGDHPKKDICDKLQGDYPKDFVFDGWHPQCFCYVTPITLPPEETAHLTEMMLKGEDWRAELARLKKGREITSYPENFKSWVRSNAENIAEARARGTEPYFIRNNATAIDKILNNEPQTPTTQNIEQKTDVPETTPETIVEKPLAPIEKIDDSIPTMHAVRDNNKLSAKERLFNALDMLDYYHGENGLWKGMSEIIRKNYLNAKALSPRAEQLYLEENLKLIKKNKWLRKEDDPFYDAINHLSALKNIERSQVAQPWQSEFNEIIKRINASDIGKNGFKSVYNDVEHAYNIVQLSKNDQVLAFGIENVSTKMPYNLLTQYQAKIPGMTLAGNIASKEFWDSLPRYTPLVNLPRTNGAHFSPMYKYVHISLDKDAVARLNASPWYQKGLLHHEFGHAYDDMLGLRKNKQVIELYDKFKLAIKRDNAISIEKKINELQYSAWNSDEAQKILAAKEDAYIALIEKYPDKTTNEILDLWKKTKEFKIYDSFQKDLDEQLGGLSDCVMGAIEGKRWIAPRGHGGNYFKSKDSQVAEFIAHMSENYWSRNEYFKQLAPGTYYRMRKLYEQIIKSAK